MTEPVYLFTVLRSPTVDGVNLSKAGFVPYDGAKEIIKSEISSEFAAGYTEGLLKELKRNEKRSRIGAFNEFTPDVSNIIPETVRKYDNKDVFYFESKINNPKIKNDYVAQFSGPKRQLIEALSTFVPEGNGTGGRDSLTDLQTIINGINALDAVNLLKDGIESLT